MQLVALLAQWVFTPWRFRDMLSAALVINKWIGASRDFSRPGPIPLTFLGSNDLNWPGAAQELVQGLNKFLEPSGAHCYHSCPK